MANYILTYTKKKINPLEPKIEDIDIIDIAHSLSLMTRANGHFKHFYSVAQHTLNCYKEAKERGYSRRVQLGCLLHDASESYLSDLTRPVKVWFTQYHEIEKNLQSAIYNKYGIGDFSEEEEALIKEIDDCILYHEFKEVMGVLIRDEEPKVYLNHDYSQRDFLAMEKEFVATFYELTKIDK